VYVKPTLNRSLCHYGIAYTDKDNALQICQVAADTVKEECKLQVSENKVLRKIFMPKKDDVDNLYYYMRNFVIQQVI
jgi:hypothetical protein